MLKIFKPDAPDIYYPCIFQRKNGIMSYYSPSVCPSINLYIPLSVSHPTINVRPTLSYHFAIIQVLMILPQNKIYLWIIKKVKTFVYGGSHIQHISKEFYLLIFRSPSRMEILMEGCGEYSFSLIILKENCLLLQLPINLA